MKDWREEFIEKIQKTFDGGDGSAWEKHIINCIPNLTIYTIDGMLNSSSSNWTKPVLDQLTYYSSITDYILLGLE